MVLLVCLRKESLIPGSLRVRHSGVLVSGPLSASNMQMCCKRLTDSAEICRTSIILRLQCIWKDIDNCQCMVLVMRAIYSLTNWNNSAFSYCKIFLNEYIVKPCFHFVSVFQKVLKWTQTDCCVTFHHKTFFGRKWKV